LTRLGAGEGAGSPRMARTSDLIMSAYPAVPGRRVSAGSGIHAPQCWGLWIPGSLALLAPLNDKNDYCATQPPSIE
jgi:hypothetical protein